MADNTKYLSFKTHGCCVIIPTYNNERTLEDVIRGVMEFTGDIIVVNDGSTDSTRGIIGQFPGITAIHLEKNKGKGFAIRQGFKEAIKQGFRNAITIDSDGQHLPADLPLFAEKIQEEPGWLIIGARNMKQAGIPGGSTFGNRFSNFWTWIETGYRLPDTQSGYRLYPIEKIGNTHFFTNRFEFEIEVLVRSAWKGIPLTSVPVGVVYHQGKERVSHFRPFIDFTRISVLNTCLVILAALFFRPWMIFREMMKGGFKQMLRTQLFNPDESNFKKSASMAIGIFMGIMPVWGWQMAIALALAVALKLNKAITLIASNISIPPFIPFILFGSYITGGLVLNIDRKIEFGSGITFEFVKNNLVQYIVGSLVFGLAMGLLAGAVTWVALVIFRRK
jgi:glycosyltransferase involved in cell wall biosynthesis